MAELNIPRYSTSADLSKDFVDIPLTVPKITSRTKEDLDNEYFEYTSSKERIKRKKYLNENDAKSEFGEKSAENKSEENSAKNESEVNDSKVVELRGVTDRIRNRSNHTSGKKRRIFVNRRRLTCRSIRYILYISLILSSFLIIFDHKGNF